MAVLHSFFLLFMFTVAQTFETVETPDFACTRELPTSINLQLRHSFNCQQAVQELASLPKRPLIGFGLERIFGSDCYKHKEKHVSLPITSWSLGQLADVR